MRPPEEVKREFVRQWVAKAASHLGVARHLLSDGSPYVEVICFHAQQAAEKYLKAFLVERQIEFPKTHDLGRSSISSPRLIHVSRSLFGMSLHLPPTAWTSVIPATCRRSLRKTRGRRWNLP
ncbi:MAG: HEPN domain-containing protein, partial [Armatimonadota bacterium]